MDGFPNFMHITPLPPANNPLGVPKAYLRHTSHTFNFYSPDHYLNNTPDYSLYQPIYNLIENMNRDVTLSLNQTFPETN